MVSITEKAYREFQQNKEKMNYSDVAWKEILLKFYNQAKFHNETELTHELEKELEKYKEVTVISSQEILEANNYWIKEITKKVFRLSERLCRIEEKLGISVSEEDLPVYYELSEKGKEERYRLKVEKQ